ncbi:CST complex subunit STN1-like isoform X2 [Schistocerca cancellata]|uniref:CST complex subunit STN1-like isoform X2 n=1 Tax=Schistocerca cancellata TaxID=274614 RepID=UPI0021172E99|nr:CST complex subunit STN1-like isoform X2 [Schistocerca cancellata]
MKANARKSVRRLQSCNIPVKLWIADISNMCQHHIFTFAYIFKGRFTKSVDIMGTVTSRAEYASFFIYIVDDGTGAIVCKLNKNLKIDEDRYEELLLSKKRIAESPMPAHMKQMSRMWFTSLEAFVRSPKISAASFFLSSNELILSANFFLLLEARSLTEKYSQILQ